MACPNNTGALLAGLAWLPWSEDPSGDCPAVIVQFLESLEIDVSMALGSSSGRKELSEWLGNRFGRSHREKVRWFEVGIHTMAAASAFADGASSEAAENAMTAYRAVLQEARVSLEARDRIAALVRELALTPLDQQIFARLLDALGEQSRIQSPSTAPGPRMNHRAAAAHYLTVAVVIIIALVSFSGSVPLLALPVILVAGLVLTTAIGGFETFRD